MWPFVKFGRQVQADVPPPGVEDFADFTARPGAADAAQWREGDVPSLDDPYFPTIARQDAVLVHWDRPPPDTDGSAWWQDRDLWRVRQNEIENLIATPSGLTGVPNQYADNPNWNPAPNTSRPTANMSPSTWRYTRPFAQETDPNFNGVHTSLADLHTAYELRGAVGRNVPWNNSYRLDPVSNDQTAVFVGDTVTQSGQVLSYGVPQVFGGNSYRLD